MTTNDQPQMIPAGLTRDQARAVHEWAERARAAKVQDEIIVHAARVLLAVLPKPLTMEDMTSEERSACRWMQCDYAGEVSDVLSRGVIGYFDFGERKAIILTETCGIVRRNYDRVTPRPDLPRLEWPHTYQEAKDETPAKIGDVIESADDPRIDALPVGSILLDRDGKPYTVTKNHNGEWDGPGFVPTQGTGTKWGPWTVRRIGREADQ